MSFCHGLLKHIKNPALDPEIRVCMYSNLCRNLIRSFKPNTFDIIRKFVRIGFQDLIHFTAILLIDFCCQCCTDSKVL